MIAIYVLIAFIMLIVPLPAGVLDVFMAFNIAIAFTILFACMFIKEVLDMSYFPTILLFTTIFRIAMNVSSTRLILTTGTSGNVVMTFGQFVGGGDLIVGAIVFIILIMIQFLVINKGSERVAEVTARFTLDAMPGKQMAIDADLNTGAIDDKEAKLRRDKIQQESSFFGSMDGAVKYVKGDAIAGLLLTLINVVGGIAMGMLRNVNGCPGDQGKQGIGVRACHCQTAFRHSQGNVPGGRDAYFSGCVYGPEYHSVYGDGVAVRCGRQDDCQQPGNRCH